MEGLAANGAPRLGRCRGERGCARGAARGPIVRGPLSSDVSMAVSPSAFPPTPLQPTIVGKTPCGLAEG